MKAARLENGSLQLTELPTPQLAYEDALIRMTSAGVCHSDLHIVRGDWAGVPSNMPLGHEGIGIVEALGPGADPSVARGARGIPGPGGSGAGYWCGAWEYCL